MSYLGRSAKLSLKAQEKVSFLATAGQTVKTGLSYTPSFVEVYVNGVLLTDTTDFTATNGNSITFTVALLLNDEVTVISLKTFTVADHYSKTEADTLLAAKSPLASPTFTGNVGIGVVPEAWNTNQTALQVGNRLALSNTSSGYVNLSSNYYQHTDGASKYIVTDEASQISLNPDGTIGFSVAPSGTADSAISWNTAMTIDNSGKVLLGTATVNGAGGVTVAPNADGDTANLVWNKTAPSATGAILFNYNGSTKGSISYTSTATTYSTSSDYRLKENVTPMSGATAQTKLLKPCNFDWIIGGNVNGFIAHELAEVVPEAVTGTKDAMRDEEYEVTPATDTTPAVMGTRSVPDMQGIDQSKLVPLLTATIQELIARIEALEGE